MPPEKADSLFKKLKDALATGKAEDMDIPPDIPVPVEPLEEHEHLDEPQPKAGELPEGLPLKETPRKDWLRRWEEEHDK